MMGIRQTIAVLFGSAVLICSAQAQEFQVVKAKALADVSVDQLKPKTVIFNDHREDELFERGTGFVKFDDWGRVLPVQKQFLSLYPGYVETSTTKTVDGQAKTYKDRLHMYIAEARFLVSKPANALNLARYTTLPFIESIDPSIKHQVIKATETTLLKEERNVSNKHPEREWCEGKSVAICIRSRYQLEGKIPMGVALANKLRESARRLQPFVEFESELRTLSPADIDEAGLMKLTGINTPVVAVLEQNIFAVNQIIRFGKFIAIAQPHPGNPNNTVTTVMISIAVASTTLEMKKNYEDVPVLRNLVPSQVLLGNSSFNTGNSLSAGLPAYARNRIKAIAESLDKN
jgi:hypothetical protein